jgi:HlyD family secretion protein
MSAPWSARGEVITGLACLAVLVGGFGTWSVVAAIAGAVVAGGQVEIAQNRQVVQHPDGGVVAAIAVAEGDSVAAGQVLIRLDPVQLASELAIVEGQLFEMIARRGRLEAERDSRAEIAFDPLLHELSSRLAQAASLIEVQNRLLDARRATALSERAQLEKRRSQIGDQVGGLKAQRDSLGIQAGLIAQEAASQQVLRDKGLTQTSRLLALRREEARLAGALGEVTAQIAQAEGRKTEIDMEVLRLEAARREEAISALDALQYRELELRERRDALAKRIGRLNIVAPVAGIVHGLEVFAPRSVLRPAQPALFIVPQDGPLIIAARLRTTDIDLVHPGQQVTVRLPALDQHVTPELTGEVTRVSPDAFLDERTQQGYYSVRVTLPEDQLARIPGGIMLVPGMPVEVMFRTGDRPPITFLVKPLTDYFARALRG